MIGVDCYALCEHVRTGSIEDTKYEYMYTYKYPDETVPDGGEAAYAKTLKKRFWDTIWMSRYLGSRKTIHILM